MIESTLAQWLGNLETPLYPLAIPDDQEAPGIVYRIESEFTPSDDDAPYGAQGHRIRLAVWHKSYKSASLIVDELRSILREEHEGFLVSVEDRGDYQDLDTNLYGIVLDVEITTLQIVTEPEQLGFRGAIQSLLFDKTAAGLSVFGTRIGFSNAWQYPKIGISMPSNTIETGNADQQIDAELVINIMTYSSIDSENELEIIANQVQRQVSPDTKLNGVNMAFNLERIATEYTSVGRIHFEHKKLTFITRYYSEIPDTENAPGYNHQDGVKVPDFNINGVYWDLDQDGKGEVEDQFTINT
jgi:hypothetical protein